MPRHSREQWRLAKHLLSRMRLRDGKRNQSHTCLCQRQRQRRQEVGAVRRSGRSPMLLGCARTPIRRYGAGHRLSEAVS